MRGSRVPSTSLERIKAWFRRSVQEPVEPVATPPLGADRVVPGEPERETSTNAQTEGATDEPWPGNT